MKYYALLLLAALPATSISSSSEQWAEVSNPICRENPVVEAEMQYRDYQIRISSTGEQACRSFDVIKGGERVYHDEEIGGYFYFGDDLDKESKPILDLSGEGNANLVMSKWTGGAHCCFSLHIFELGRKFRSVAHIGGGNFQPYLEDLNGDDVPEIKVTDDFLAYRFSSFAYSSTAQVILEYSEGTYRVAADFMKKTAPDFFSLDKEIRSWQNEFRATAAGDYPPPRFIQSVTDLFFTGNKELALDVINRAWPIDIPGKVDFIHSYEDALKESEFYEEFERQLANY